jgi:hypothetical protein
MNELGKNMEGLDWQYVGKREKADGGTELSNPARTQDSLNFS